MSDEDTKSSIYAGGLPYDLTEGDIICVFSQYGEIYEISLSRDKETGKSRGFCFIKYEDPRSCELAVDNLNGTTIVGRKIKVSYANNTNAIKASRPTIVAPQVFDTSLQQGNKDSREASRYNSKRKHDSPSPYSRGRHHSPRNRDESLSPRREGHHRSSRHKDESLSPQPKSRHHSSRYRDESLSPRPKSRHHSSKLKSDNSSPPSKSHHKSSKHKKERSSPHRKSHHHKSKSRRDRSSSRSKKHHSSSRRSHHESVDRSSRSGTSKKTK